MSEYERLKQIVARLRAQGGCPWDRAQTHESLKPECIEEAAEVLSGINILSETGRFENLREELGDLLLQVVFHAQIAEEDGQFTLDDVFAAVSDKMIRRHPHVFSPEEVRAAWDRLEAESNGRPDGTAGAGMSGQGNGGGVGLKKDNNAFYGGGGGGAMAAGASVSSGNTISAGKGGDGREYSISGIATFYAGGGGGGGTRSQKESSFGSPGDGGNGGGGRGGQRVDATDNTPDDMRAARNGVDGLGGGGGGGGDTTGFYQGGDGGNGVVIVRYAVQGSGSGMTDPAVALESLDRGANGVTTVGYRVAWAGDGYDYADVKVAWGFSKDDLPNTNAIASSAIGRGTGTFTLADQTKTVYVRAVAVNAGGHAAASPEVVTIPFVDPAAPEVEQPVVSGISSMGASFSAAVIGLGTGAASVRGVFQVCTEDDFEGTVLSFPAAQTVTEVPGSLTAQATGLSVNTLYYVRVSATNDVPAVFETEPVSFRTGVPGAPNGSVVTDPTKVANPPTECTVPTATDTTITAWGYLFTPGSNGATSADLRLEASTDANFQAVAAYSATATGVTERGFRSFTLTDLEPETAYYLRLRSENDGRVVAYSAIVGPYTTLPRPTVITVW